MLDPGEGKDMRNSPRIQGILSEFDTMVFCQTQTPWGIDAIQEAVFQDSQLFQG